MHKCISDLIECTLYNQDQSNENAYKNTTVKSTKQWILPLRTANSLLYWYLYTTMWICLICRFSQNHLPITGKTSITYFLEINYDVFKWNHFPRYWLFVRRIYRLSWIPLTKPNDTELWYFLWFAPEQTAWQTIETLMTWDAITLIVT